MRVYKYIRDNGGWDNWDMILIEQCKCENRLDSLRKEREYIELFEATLNKQIPTQSSVEYMRKKTAANPEQMRARGLEWKRLHKIRKKAMEEEDIANKNEAMQAKTNRLHELLKTHIQDLDIIEEILALV